ncbi:MAG: DUF4340 domain-containing protein [Oligoflexia bacterium]|nr:DUF4340 domain-containing protein [Oligoflexia bacterium]
MKPRFFVQILISVCVLAFGAWAVYEYYQSQKERKKEEQLSLFLPHTKLKQLKAFQIEQADKKLSAVKKEKEWFLTEPVKDLLDWTELSRWFDSIAKQKVQRIKEENPDWKSYYLDSAPFVQMELSSGETITFSVSRKSSFDGRYFIRKGEELLIGGSAFLSEVNEKNLEDFISKKILPALNHAERIQFKGKSNFQLNWNNYKWSLEGADQKSLPLDSSRLDGFWTDLNSMKALSMKEAVSSHSLGKYQLNKPQLILNISYGDKEYVFQLSPFKKDKAFVSISHRDYIFEISKETADKLLLSKKEIYDHNFPFHYKTDLAVQVERKDDKNSFIIKKEKEIWKSSEGKTVDSKKVEALLDQVKELRGERYEKGTDKTPLRHLVIKDSENRLLFELKEISQSKAVSWVQTNLWPERIAISKNAVSEIFSQDVFLKSEAPSSSSKTNEKTPSESAGSQE